MNINKDFIDQVVNSFHGELTARPDLCKTCQAEYSMNFYQRKAYQELYALRFLPAYYFEYCALARMLHERAKKYNYEHLKIISLGCGLSPDYYAFRDNLPPIEFTYYGYDAVEWTSRQHMPEVGDNHNFIFDNAENISENDLSDIDVFVFPKSIGDIENNSRGLIEKFGQKVAKTGKDRIFFLNSYVTKRFNAPADRNIFRTIHESLLDQGYQTSDNPENSYYLHPGDTTNKPIGLRKIHHNFVYPDGKSITCNKMQPSQDICNECMVPRKPILTNQYMSYSILEYIRS